MRSRQRAVSRHEADVSRLSPLVAGFLFVAIVCVAAGLRFYRLDVQSFWNDEGNSARIAERSLALIVEGAAGDIHPPGYYLLLHAWRGLFGQTEFALRSLSVVAGLALVVFTGLLGRHVFGTTAGLLAASLSALSPFAVYYSQEARMYALLGALSAASTYVAIRTLDDLGGGSRGEDGIARLTYPAAYALISAVGLYTHYAFAFVLVAHNVAFGLHWLAGWIGSRPNWRGLLIWGGAQLIAGLLYLPWVPTVLSAAGWSSAGRGCALGSALLDVARVLVVGVTQSLGDAAIVVAGFAGLMLIGLWPGVSQRSRGGKEAPRWLDTASLALYLIVPLGLFLGFDLYKPAWLKFLVILLPSFHVLVAHGVVNLAGVVSRAGGVAESRRRAVSALVAGGFIVALAVALFPSLHNLYFDPAYARDDYRQLAADIREMWRPTDAIVLNAPNQWEVFTYYYPDRDVYPAPYRPRPGRTAAFLEPLRDEYERLFVLYWGDAEADPRKRVESWLADHAYKAGDQWYGDVRLATYGLAPSSQLPEASVDALFGRRILLRGYALLGEAFAPGDIIPVTLFWEALGAVESPYKVSVQMLNPDEGQLVGQHDTVPSDGLAPTTSWEGGMTLVDRYGILVPRDTSPGRYSLIVAVYHAVTGERLPVAIDGEPMGDFLSLGHVTVTAGGQ